MFCMVIVLSVHVLYSDSAERTCFLYSDSAERTRFIQ